MPRQLARTLICLASVVCLSANGQAATPYIPLGPADPLTIDQPRVAVAVTNADQSFVYGPDISNFWLLDTGAQGILAGQTAYDEMTANGYTTVAQFNELGVAGTVVYDVSEAYDFLWAGTDGAPYTIDDARLLSASTGSFGSFGGIAGTPVMLGRVSSFDMTAMVDTSASQPLIGVDFNPVAPAGNGHRYSVPLTMVDYPATGGQQNPGDPLPTYGELPFVSVTTRNGNDTQTGNFLVDTGAQLSIISSDIAFALGMDTDGDGNFDNEAIAWQQLGGVGGSVLAPQVPMDTLAVMTDEGVELIWSDLAPVILDIDESIDGIFGNELLTSGWFDAVFNALLDEPFENGYFEQVHVDFSQPGSERLLLDLNPDIDNVVPEPASLGLLAIGAIGLLRRRRLSGRS